MGLMGSVGSVDTLESIVTIRSLSSVSLPLGVGISSGSPPAGVEALPPHAEAGEEEAKAG